MVKKVEEKRRMVQVNVRALRACEAMDGIMSETHLNAVIGHKSTISLSASEDGELTIEFHWSDGSKSTITSDGVTDRGQAIDPDPRDAWSSGS